jgi:hypothetical protein
VRLDTEALESNVLDIQERDESNQRPLQMVAVQETAPQIEYTTDQAEEFEIVPEEVTMHPQTQTSLPGALRLTSS